MGSRKADSGSGCGRPSNRHANSAGTREIVTTDYDYDGIGRLANMLHNSGSTNFAGYDFTYDAASRITSIDSLVDGLTTYTHDATGQLTGADHTSQTDESYSYDENGKGMSIAAASRRA